MLIHKVFTICLLFVYGFSHEDHDYSIYEGLRGAAMSIVEDCLYKATSTVVMTTKVSNPKFSLHVDMISSFLIEHMETGILLYVGSRSSKPWNFNVLLVDDVKAFL